MTHLPDSGSSSVSPNSAPLTPPKPRLGCLGWALVSIVVGVLILVGIGTYVARRAMNELRDYTASAPMDLPAVTLSELELHELEVAWESFRESVEAGKPARVALTGPQVNSLIHTQVLRNLNGWRTHLVFSNGLATLQASVPTESLFQGTPTFGMGNEKRYLNGTLVIAVAKTNTALSIHIQDIRLEAASQLDAETIQQFKAQNLAQDLPESSIGDLLKSLKRIEIEGDMLVLEG